MQCIRTTSPADRAYFEMSASVATGVLITFVYGGMELEFYHSLCASKYSPLLRRMQLTCTAWGRVP